MTHSLDEILDLVDDNDNVIGKRSRNEIYKEGLRNFRVINAFLVNAQGQLWIPRRAADKRIFPLCLDMSVGGHVESGETYEQALTRETMEELNIDLNTVPFRLLGKLTPMHHGVSAFMHVYEIKSAEAPLYNKNDFIEYFWLTKDEFFDKIKNDKAKGDLPYLIKHFY